MNAHYLAVTSEFTNTTDGGVTFAADTLVYKWLGEHFDIIQRLPTSGAKAATSFTVDSNQYLVVANHIDDQGESSVASYSLSSECSGFLVEGTMSNCC